MNAIKDKLAANAKGVANAPDLEEAICKSVALARLLAERVAGGDALNMDNPHNKTFVAGLNMLVGDVNENLRDAFYHEDGGSRVETRDPLAWDRAGAMNTTSDGSPIECAVAGRGRAMKRKAEAMAQSGTDQSLKAVALKLKGTMR